MLSFIMSSWDLLFLRITSSHVSLKTEVNDVLTDYDYIENKQTIVLGKYIVHLFQTIPWWHDKKDKMWSKIAFMLSSRHKSLFSEKQLLWRMSQNKGFLDFILSFIMSSWDLLFLRSTSSRCFKNHGGPKTSG